MSIVPPDQPLHAPHPLDHTSLQDLEAIRLLLTGSSVIDWHQLAFSSEAEVRRFLRVNEFDPDDERDMRRLDELRAEAVEYLTRQLEYRIPPEVASGMPAHELLLTASQKGRHQTYACIVLKVMHVMHHLNSREALFRLPVSDDQVFGLVESKVVHVVEEIRGAGYPIVEFAWSRKERHSLITKLLAKRDSIAAHVYDKLRFRLITRRREDLPAVLQEMFHRLIPFNYVIPGQTVNRLLPFRRLLEETPALRRYADQLQQGLDLEEPTGPDNTFSSSGYKVLNFVVDLPVRIESVLRHVGSSLGDLGLDPRGVVFVLSEFQLIDAETAADNERGDNSHAAYKERQRIMVKARLTRGMRQRVRSDRER
ncbi:MAG: TIGR04552 family protein [Myxococcales bacterium]|nr:TIGR04552 family protein [Myxococcota bacterium]MDW8284029.1 TIGR04552 family protein [Myxococcales bacterium]